MDGSSGKSVESYAKVYPNQRTPEEKTEPPPPPKKPADQLGRPETRGTSSRVQNEDGQVLTAGEPNSGESGAEDGGDRQRNVWPERENKFEAMARTAHFRDIGVPRKDQEADGGVKRREPHREGNPQGNESGFQEKKTEWEESWWLTLVQEIKSAEGSGDTRRKYQTLREIGIKDLRVIEEEHFTADEYRAHFMKVSERRYERTAEEIRETAEKIPYRNDITTTQAGEKLASDVSFEEFYHELQKIKDNSAGVDGVRLIALKVLSGGAQERLYNCLIDLLNTPADRWPAITREGWIVPLFKKSEEEG